MITNKKTINKTGSLAPFMLVDKPKNKTGFINVSLTFFIVNTIQPNQLKTRLKNKYILVRTYNQEYQKCDIDIKVTKKYILDKPQDKLNSYSYAGMKKNTN